MLLQHKLGGLRERFAELVQPVAGLGAHGDDRRARHQLARLLHRQLERLGVDRVRLRHRHDAVLDPEQPHDREVLVRLRPRPLARVDHEQEEVDAGRARDHVADEALVARHVDQREPAPVGEVERRVAEVDRDPPLLLLGQPVGVLSGQRPHEPRLAVVDVPGGAYRERHASTACAASSASASVSVRQSSSVRPSRTTATTGGSCSRSARRELLLDRAREARQLGERHRAAADARHRLLDRSVDRCGEPLGPRPHASTGSRSIRSTGISSGRSR